jgi:pimeloyl-ACP methyl ester carboxylesterase
MILNHTVTGSGAPVVLIHSGVTDLRMWEPLAGLAEHFTLVAPDLRGFGQSPVPEADEKWSNGRDVLALMDHLEIETAAVVGSSYGGRVALEVATLAPERVRRLVLLCSALAGTDPTESVKAYGAKEEGLLEAGDVDGASRLNAETWLGPEADKAAHDLVFDMQRRAFEVQMAAEEVEPTEVDVDLSRLTMPTTIYFGAHDFDYFEQIARHLHEHIPGSELVGLPWAGHMPALERPAEMTTRLTEALSTG